MLALHSDLPQTLYIVISDTVDDWEAQDSRQISTAVFTE